MILGLNHCSVTGTKWIQQKFDCSVPFVPHILLKWCGMWLLLQDILAWYVFFLFKLVSSPFNLGIPKTIFHGKSKRFLPQKKTKEPNTLFYFPLKVARVWRALCLENKWLGWVYVQGRIWQQHPFSHIMYSIVGEQCALWSRQKKSDQQIKASMRYFSIQFTGANSSTLTFQRLYLSPDTFNMKLGKRWQIIEKLVFPH